MFRGVPRRSEAFRGLGTPRNTSGDLGLPDLSIPGTNGGKSRPPPLVPAMLKSVSPRSPKVFQALFSGERHGRRLAPPLVAEFLIGVRGLVRSPKVSRAPVAA